MNPKFSKICVTSPETKLPARNATKISSAAPRISPVALRSLSKNPATEFESESIFSAVSDEIRTGIATSTYATIPIIDDSPLSPNSLEIPALFASESIPETAISPVTALRTILAAIRPMNRIATAAIRFGI